MCMRSTTDLKHPGGLDYPIWKIDDRYNKCRQHL